MKPHPSHLLASESAKFLAVTQNVVLLLCGAGLALCLAAVVVDRLNFPQRRFRPKMTEVEERHSSRDRTGAHVQSLKTEESPE